MTVWQWRRIFSFFGLLFVIYLLTGTEARAVLGNGANAIDAIGQYATDSTVSYTKDRNNNGPNLFGLDTPYEAAIDAVNHRLFVADSNNNRVLVYNLNTDNTLPDKTPDYVLGQPDFTTSTSGTTQAKLSMPYGLAYDSANNRLFVSDGLNNRVMVFDVASITNGENAVNVLGQSGFTTATSGTSQATLSLPYGLAYDSSNSRLFVADLNNNRVMVFDAASITDGENAANVLGQTTFTAGSSGITQARLAYPYGLAYSAANSRLFVSDGFNHRVMVFDVAAITNGENAAYVLGQTNFTDNTSGTTQAKLYSPTGLAFSAANSRLFVSDGLNNRVMVFDVTAITNGENAIYVLGQTTFTVETSGTTQAKFVSPAGLAYDADNSLLFVLDRDNHRVMVFNVSAITNGENAVDALGQYAVDSSVSYVKNGQNDGPNLLGFEGPYGVLLDATNHRLFVSDGNNRVLVHTLNTDNSLPDKTPDYVLGQPDFTTKTAGTTQAKLSGPRGMSYDAANNRLFVAEVTNRRVTVFDVASITNGENAAYVLCQPNFTTATSGTTQAKCDSPDSVFYDSSSNRLFVSDYLNNRVMVFDVAAITNGENATNVLGQTDFSTVTSGITQAKFNRPAGVYYDASRKRLFVSDFLNSRVMVFDLTAITNGENAVNVLGQPDFTTATGGTTIAKLNRPSGLFLDIENSRLFVSDSSNNRVIVYEVSTITDGENAVSVLGQTNFTTSTGGVTQAKLSGPQGAFYSPEISQLFVADRLSDRVMTFDATTLEGQHFLIPGFD